MSEGMSSGASAPTSAPSSAPTSAPAGPAGGSPSPVGKSPVGMAPMPPRGLQEAPAAGENEPTATGKLRYPYKTKIGDAEHEIDLADYRHRVKIDGQDYDLSLDELSKNQERLRSSMKRFEQAARLQKETESKAAQLAEREQRITTALSDPKSAFQILRRTLGEDGLLSAAIDLVRSRADYEKLPPEQRQIHDRYMRQQSELERRQADLERREAEIKRANEEREARLTQEHRTRLLAEWVPALEAAGLPAKVDGQPNMRLVRMLAETLRVARVNKIPLTFSEAIAEVKRDFESMFSFASQRQQAAAVAALEAQPGRMPPETPATPARAPAPRRPISAEEYARNLRRTWDKR